MRKTFLRVTEYLSVLETSVALKHGVTGNPATFFQFNEEDLKVIFEEGCLTNKQLLILCRQTQSTSAR